MSSRSFDLPVGISSYVVAGVAAAALVVVVSKPSKLDAIPTFGCSGWFSSWWAGLKYRTNGMDVIQKGYEKYKSSPFKVAAFYEWLVVLNSREHVEELYRAPDDALSFSAAFYHRIQMDYTLGGEIYHSPYHVPIVRSRLTRNLDVLFPQIRDEIIAAFEDVLSLNGNEWKSVPAVSRVHQVVGRTGNKMLVGLPLCRNSDWIDLNIQYTIDLNKAANIIRFFPGILKPLASRLFTNIYQSKQRGKNLLGPVIEERQRYLNEHGNEWADKPNDFLSWMMEEAEGPELTVESLTSRILFMNVASIHTTSVGFTHALFCLAANPQYIQPLREEVQGIVQKEGWSRVALGKMRKVDSFLKECQRLVGHNYLGLQRKALKDYTFSDGTFVPKGTMMATIAWSIHHDETTYENALAFEPFRFARLGDDDNEGVKHQYVSTSADYLPFGHGRQACPGRFFAGNELKLMLAHVVVTYDVKLEDNARRPEALRFVTMLLPDPRVKVMFRRRVD